MNQLYTLIELSNLIPLLAEKKHIPHLLVLCIQVTSRGNTKVDKQLFNLVASWINASILVEHSKVSFGEVNFSLE